MSTERQSNHWDEQWRYSALAAHDETQAIAAWAKRNAPRVNPRLHSGSRDLIRAFVIETTRPASRTRSTGIGRALRALRLL